MFILAYIYFISLSLISCIKFILGGNFGLFLAASGIFTLLYINLVIMFKYIDIFIKKTVKKEPLNKKEICFLITSIVIFVAIGVIVTPIYNEQIPYSDSRISGLETFLNLTFFYLAAMIIFSIIVPPFSSDFSFLLSTGSLALLMWGNIIVLYKYLKISIHKMTEKEFLTQKEIILLVTSIVLFVAIGTPLIDVFYWL